MLLDFSLIAPGGSTTYAIGFLGALPRISRSSPLVVLLPARRDFDEVASSLVGPGIVVRRETVPSPGSWRARVWAQLTLARIARDVRPSIMFVTREIAPVSGTDKVAVLARNTLVWDQRPAKLDASVLRRLQRAAARRAVRRSVAVIAPSAAMAAMLPPAARGRVTVIPYGCDLPAVDGSGKEAGVPGETRPLHVLSVGTVIPHKRFELAIAIVSALRRQGLEVDYRVLGGEPDPLYSRGLRAKAVDALGSDPFRGEVSRTEVADHQMWADVLLVANSNESFGHHLVEAMRSRAVVVAPFSPLLDEVCGADAIAYRLGDVEDAVRSIDAGLSALTRIAGGAQARSLDLTWERCVERTLGVLEGAS